MSFDAENAIWTTAISTAVTLVVATWKVGREEKAKRSAAAREEVHGIVGEVLSEVIGFRAGFGGHRVWGSTLWVSDYTWASRILIAARRLNWIRRHVMRSQLRWLVGSLAFNLAEAQPEPEPQSAMGKAMWWQVKSRREVTSEREAERLFRPGALEMVLRGEHDSKDVRLLEHVLRWLARSW